MKIQDTLFHKTLVAAGFTYQYNKIPPGATLHWKHNWSNGEIYFCAQEPTERVDTETDWVSRIIQTSEPSPYHGQSSAEIIAALKKDTEVKNNKITPENIEGVLRYNDIPQSKYSVLTSCVRWYSCKCSDGADYSIDCHFKSPRWLDHLELETGKLKPLPEFDFADYLIQNGWLVDDSNQLILGNGALWVHLGNNTLCDDYETFTPDKDNADRLIELAELAKEIR